MAPLHLSISNSAACDDSLKETAPCWHKHLDDQTETEHIGGEVIGSQSKSNPGNFSPIIVSHPELRSDKDARLAWCFFGARTALIGGRVRRRETASGGSDVPPMINTTGVKDEGK